MAVQFSKRSSDPYIATSDKDTSWTVINDPFIVYDVEKGSGNDKKYGVDGIMYRQYYDIDGVASDKLLIRDYVYSASQSSDKLTIG